jgi:hypothetical protein
MLGNLLHALGDFRAEVIAAQRQLALDQLVAAGVAEDQRLEIIDVTNVVGLDFRLDHFEELTMHSLQWHDDREIGLFQNLRHRFASVWVKRDHSTLV